jgi:hypothetical protein
VQVIVVHYDFEMIMSNKFNKIANTSVALRWSPTLHDIVGITKSRLLSQTGRDGSCERYPEQFIVTVPEIL